MLCGIMMQWSKASFCTLQHVQYMCILTLLIPFIYTCSCFIITIAPSGPPTNFEATSTNENPHQLTLSWDPPNNDDRNGIITLYHYNCTNRGNSSDTHTDSTSTTSASIGGLLVFTNYTCSVTPATVVGVGTMSAFYRARTGEDGMYKELCY